MEAGFVVLVVISALMSLLVAEDGVVPRNPASLAGLATILAGTSAWIRTLGSAGSYNQEKKIRSLVADSRYGADLTIKGRSMSFRLREEKNVPFEATRRPNGIDTNEAITWLLPLHFRIYARITACICVIVIGVIVALEIVLDQSQRYDGLSNVTTGNYLHFVWPCVPALVMVAIQLFVNSVD